MPPIAPEPMVSPEQADTTPAPELPQEREVIPEPISVQESPVVKEEESTPVISKEEEIITTPTSVEVKVEMGPTDSEVADVELQTPIEREETPQTTEVKPDDITAEIVEKPEDSRTDKVFRLNKNKLESNIVVKGSIDLDAINDRTRPPRKSRAQRKKERLEREQKAIVFAVHVKAVDQVGDESTHRHQ